MKIDKKELKLWLNWLLELDEFDSYGFINEDDRLRLEDTIKALDDDGLEIEGYEKVKKSVSGPMITPEEREKRLNNDDWHKFDKDDKSTYPEDGANVLVCENDGKYYCCFFEEGWFRMILLREDFVFRSGVIAWRELPEPPKF